MRVMEMTVHQVVHVIAMRNGLVPAPRAVLVTGVVRVAGMIGRAVGRVRSADRQLVFVHVVRVGMVEMTIVQVVDVALVAKGEVAAVFAMRVFVAVVPIAGHCCSPSMGTWGA